MERPREQEQHMPTLELLSDQERYDAAFDIAEQLINSDSSYLDRLAELANEIDSRDSRIGRDFAMTAVLSLSERR